MLLLTSRATNTLSDFSKKKVNFIRINDFVTESLVCIFVDF